MEKKLKERLEMYKNWRNEIVAQRTKLQDELMKIPKIDEAIATIYRNELDRLFDRLTDKVLVINELELIIRSVKA